MKVVSSQRLVQNISTGLALVSLFTLNLSASPHQQPQASSSPGQSQDEAPNSGMGSGAGHGPRGMGGLPAGARGMLGSVTEVTPEHYTIKNDQGETYTVHYSNNTRIMKQQPGRRQNSQNQSVPSQSGQSAAGQSSQLNQSGQSGQPNAGSQPGQRRRDHSSDESDRPIPETIKPTDIKVGDVITVGGEVDASKKSIGAIFIALVDPERAKQMREMEANYGKTWLAGRITAIDGTRITIEGMIDHAPHTVDVDENTSFRQRRDSITLADIKPGEQLRAEGAVKNGTFLATIVNAMSPQSRPPGANTPQPQ